MYAAIWFGSNIITIVACIASAILWRERMIIAGKFQHDRNLLPYVRRQHWRNYRWCAFWTYLNAFIGCWGALMNVAALRWAGPVPLVIWGGTAGFTVGWLAVTAVAFWDFWAVGTIARAHKEYEREAGC